MKSGKGRPCPRALNLDVPGLVSATQGSRPHSRSLQAPPQSKEQLLNPPLFSPQFLNHLLWTLYPLDQDSQEVREGVRGKGETESRMQGGSLSSRWEERGGQVSGRPEREDREGKGEMRAGGGGEQEMRENRE